MKVSAKLLFIICIGFLILLFLVLPKIASEISKPSPTPTEIPQTKDSLENQKGYQWAEDAGITSVEQCKKESKAFQQGCVNYIQDHVDDALQDADTRDE